MGLFKIILAIIVLWLVKKTYYFYKGIKISFKSRSNDKYKDLSIQDGEFEDIE